MLQWSGGTTPKRRLFNPVAATDWRGGLAPPQKTHPDNSVLEIESAEGEDPPRARSVVALGHLAPLARDVLRDWTVLSTWTANAPGPILDPIERTSEILFGVIMVLTFTGSISVAESGRAETREVLVAALGCNIAWGIVDAAFYLLSSVVGRARGRTMLRFIRESRDQSANRRLILSALPSPVAAVLTPSEIDTLQQRLVEQPEPPAKLLHHEDFFGAAWVFSLVFLSTFPIAFPFLVVTEPALAMRTSNAIAIAMLFGVGWALGTYAGRPGWRAGLVMVAVGLVLIAVTIALGG